MQRYVGIIAAESFFPSPGEFALWSRLILIFCSRILSSRGVFEVYWYPVSATKLAQLSGDLLHLTYNWDTVKE